MADHPPVSKHPLVASARYINRADHWIGCQSPQPRLPSGHVRRTLAGSSLDRADWEPASAPTVEARDTTRPTERSSTWLMPFECRVPLRAPTRPCRSRPASSPCRARGPSWPRIGRTTVLATANAAKDVRPGIDFFPLTVDVEERAYAAGKIPGSFFRREGRPTEDAILTCRLTDRPLRPAFPEGFRNETQVVLTILGADMENPHDVLSINAASAALMISAASRSTARSAPCASPTARTASGSRTPPTKRATPAPSSSSSPVVSSTTATSPS